MKLQVKNLSYTAENHKILDNISFNVDGEKMIGILGPNGAGKSTLLKLLYRELDSSHNVFINGQSIEDFDSKIFHQKVGVLAQFTKEIDPSLKVEEVLLMGRYPYKTLLSHYDEEDERIVDQVVERLSLGNLRQRSIGNLSGGELQRVMMGKVLVGDPEIIILDEPTNHLDIKYKIEFMEILKQIHGLVLVSLHDLPLAAKYCDEIIFLKDGRLLVKGAPLEILTEELLSSIYGINYRIIYEPEFIIYYS